MDPEGVCATVCCGLVCHAHNSTHSTLAALAVAPAAFFLHRAHDNSSWTVRDIIIKFSRHRPMFERADKFENSYIGVHRGDLMQISFSMCLPKLFRSVFMWWKLSEGKVTLLWHSVMYFLSSCIDFLCRESIFVWIYVCFLIADVYYVFIQWE